MQTAIVLAIVAVAVFYLGRRFYRNVQKSNVDGCSGGCGCCSQGGQSSCPNPDQPKGPI